MAEWSDTTKHPASSFNAGNQYTKDDQMSLEALNNNIENALYAARVAENAQSATNNAVSYNAQTPLATEQKQAQKNLGIDQTISFAEGEYNKSKNLFPFGNVSGTKQVQRFISLPVGTYTLSAITTSSDTDANTCLVGFYNKNTEWIGGGQLTRGTRQSITVTLTQPTTSLIFFASNNQPNSEGDNFTFADIQIEEGSIATAYYPYSGEITHNGDATVVFADAERQKSKNLFDAPSITLPTGVTYNSSTNTFTYTSGEVAEGATAFAQLNNVVMPAGNYVYSFNSTSTITGDTTYIVAKLTSTGGFESSIKTIIAPAGKVSIPFTLTEDTYIGLCWYYKTGWSEGSAPAGSKTISKVQLEQGSSATDYQPYYGAIVHRDELYPVGSIYISISSTSPASLFGGTWEELASNNTLWIIPTTDSSGGGTIDAGLPNITASLDRLSGSVYWPSDSTYGGAFSLSQVGSHKVPTGSSSNYSSGELQFSASKSNSIYGNSTTVQPPAIKVYAWKRVE